MKTLLFFLLVPFIGFSQTDLTYAVLQLTEADSAFTAQQDSIQQAPEELSFLTDVRVGIGSQPEGKLHVYSPLEDEIKEHNAKLDIQIEQLTRQIDSLIVIKHNLQNEKVLFYKDLPWREQMRFDERKKK